MTEGGNRPRGDASVRVLVVDDDPEVATLAGEYLEHTNRGLSVRTETSATDALERVEARATGFDCIVSDYEMPEMTGLEFAEAVGDTTDVPFILFTVKDAALVDGDTARVTDYVQKDATAGLYDELADRVTRAVCGAA